VSDKFRTSTTLKLVPVSTKNHVPECKFPGEPAPDPFEKSHALAH